MKKVENIQLLLGTKLWVRPISVELCHIKLELETGNFALHARNRISRNVEALCRVVDISTLDVK